MNKRYIIVGAGIAGLSAAQAIREADADGTIDIFTAENNLPYSRPMLTKAPFMAFDPADWIIHAQDWFDENNINLHKGVAVLSVNSMEKSVTTEQGNYSYDKLILATGAESFVPPIPGSCKYGVFTIRRAEDIFKIKKAFKPETRAVIIGGGVIGLEAAVELARYGASVTVLEALPYLMTKQIDEEISRIICSRLKNIDIFTDVKIASIDGETRTEGVTLADGRVFPCDMVIMACGVKAQTAQLPTENIEIQRAVVIDDRCRTSCKDIYAAGDCAQYNGVNYALWSQAMAQGITAGKNASGVDAVLTKFDTSLVINSPELSLFALGDLGKNPELKYEITYTSSKGKIGSFYVNPSQGEFFEKKYWVGGKVVGAALVGNLSRIQQLKKEMEANK